MASEQIRNWDKTQTWRPEAIHRPRDEEELAAVVRRAVDAGHRVKPIGSALSWSDCIDIPQQCFRFDRMADVVAVDVASRRVTVQAGARLADVNEALAKHGLAFDNFGSIVVQTAGGYTGTGSHGTGGRTRVLSSYITDMRLVDGRGKIHQLDAANDPDLLSTARVHLGCLGAVTQLTFQCVEAFNLEERLELMPFERVLSDLDALVDGNDYLKLWWLPYTDQIQVYRFNRTTAPKTRFSLHEWLDTSGVSSHAFSGLLALSRRVPGVIPAMHKIVQRLQFRPHRRVDRSDKIIRYAGTIPQHQEAEYAVPRQHAATVLAEVRRMVVAAKHYRMNFPLEVRFVAADDIPMSCASGRDCCYVGPYVASIPWARASFADLEVLFQDYDGRPHWGKSFSASADYLRGSYGEGYERFDAARRRLDPHGVFRNSFVDRVFPPSP